MRLRGTKQSNLLLAAWGLLRFARNDSLSSHIFSSEAAHRINDVGIDLEEGSEAGQVEDFGDVG